MTLDEEIKRLEGLKGINWPLFEYLALKAGWTKCPKCGHLANPRQTAGYICRCLLPKFAL